ncbi:MAG TPA: HIT family protein [Polyangia bacterium]|jgi:histidine triad (HIT) family protein|nr:HIT family protein [Polyangia bacterium]
MSAATGGDVTISGRQPGCVFCDIAAGDVPATVVLRDETVCAFLDQRPVFKGHVLIVPRGHAATLLDAAPEVLAAVFGAAQRVARAMEKGLSADGSFLGVNTKVSQSVPHLHVHVVPRRRKDGLRGFFWPRLPYASDEEREAFGARIRAALT